jgi:hypothetical protein
MKGKTLVFIGLSIFLLVIVISLVQEKQDVPLVKIIIEKKQLNHK